jgi:hypothetical protein
MAEFTETVEGTNPESVLRFENSGLYTEPYDLRPLFHPALSWLSGYYAGGALTATGYITAPVSRFLYVPPNVAAVVTTANGARLRLEAGRHRLVERLKSVPVSVQFVNMKRRSFAFSGVKVRSAAQMELELDLRLTVRVDAPEQVTAWSDPLGDVKSVFIEAVIRLGANRSHEETLRLLPDLLDGEVRRGVDASCGARGLAVEELVVTGIRPDKQYAEMQRIKLQEEQTELQRNVKLKDIEMREQIVDRERAIGIREAQAEEDVFAMKQPGFRRKMVGDINMQLRTFNQEARMKSIEAVSEAARALIEDLQRHPGQMHSGQVLNALQEALKLLDKLAQPTSAPPIPLQVRSLLAVDKDAPPPPDKPPLAATPPRVARPLGPNDDLPETRPN